MNWYTELSKINGIEAVAVCKQYNDYEYINGINFIDNEEKEPKPVLFKTLLEAKKLLDVDFDSGYGSTRGAFFTAWTKDLVFFPVQYDGSEWMESVPRNPCNIATKHKGGG